MSIDTKQHLTRLTQEQADEIVAHHGDLAFPRVFRGDDGSYWALSDELRAYTGYQATSHSEQTP
jgi:hypothetical protein